MNYLFADFLKNPIEFDKAKNYWESLCKEILSQNGQLNDWRNWFENEKTDLEVLDSFPMCSLINHNLTKGVIINQQDPSVHTKWETVAYIKNYSKDSAELWALQYLVFNCNLTQKSEAMFKKLFNAWTKPNCKEEDINKLIKDLNR